MPRGGVLGQHWGMGANAAPIQIVLDLTQRTQEVMVIRDKARQALYRRAVGCEEN